MAMSQDPAQRVKELREQIEHHIKRYYELDDPVVSDAEFDELMRELQGLEESYPDLQTPDSPTQKVSGATSTLFAPVRHRLPMMSLENATTFEELLAWVRRMDRFISGEVAFTCELKIYGLAVSLLYEDGRLTTAATRGDGKSVVPRVVEVRGEIYMPISAFEELNRQQAEEGARQFVNPRNSAAGSLRQKDSSITASRELSFWAYQLGDLEGGPTFTAHAQSLDWLKQVGFPVNPEIRTLHGLDEVTDFCQHWLEHRHDLDYEIDGVVVKVDDLAQRRELG